MWPGGFPPPNQMTYDIIKPRLPKVKHKDTWVCSSLAHSAKASVCGQALTCPAISSNRLQLRMYLFLKNKYGTELDDIFALLSGGNRNPLECFLCFQRHNKNFNLTYPTVM